MTDLMAAQHLTTGRAVGVDLWRTVDQSGNSAEATHRNAIAEEVADRVELNTGDLTALPFEDNRFDVVLTTSAGAPAGRKQSAKRCGCCALAVGCSSSTFGARGSTRHNLPNSGCTMSPAEG